MIMENSAKITIEDLAVKLNGKMWVKEDLKRIYLDRGYNTKKMSTKTYVEQSASGVFYVKCFIDCQSQDYNWIKSQQNQIIESVENQINEIIVKNSLKVLEVTQGKNSINAYISKNGEVAQWYCERVFLEVFGFELEEILEESIINERKEVNTKEEPAVSSPEYDTWRQLNVIDALPELSLKEIVSQESDLSTRLHANRCPNYLKESIALNNLRRRIFVGKKIEEVVSIVRNCPVFVAPFTVACVDGIVQKIEDTAYHGISSSSKMQIFMIETNSDKTNFWKKSEQGFYPYEIK